MGVAETLLHIHDITQGLRMPWLPPPPLCAAVLSRLCEDRHPLRILCAPTTRNRHRVQHRGLRRARRNSPGAGRKIDRQDTAGFLTIRNMERMVRVDPHYQLWVEDRGDPEATALLLIIGANVSGIAWPEPLSVISPPPSRASRRPGTPTSSSTTSAWRKTTARPRLNSSEQSRTWPSMPGGPKAMSAMTVAKDANAQGLSRRHIVRSVEASLKRLGMDWLDFYFVHTFDDRTLIEQTLRALDDLQPARRRPAHRKVRQQHPSRKRASGRQRPLRRPLRLGRRLRHGRPLHRLRAGGRRQVRDPRGGLGDGAPGDVRFEDRNEPKIIEPIDAIVRMSASSPRDHAMSTCTSSRSSTQRRESRITGWSISTCRPRQSRFFTWAHRMTVTSRVRRPPASSSPLCRSTCALTFPH